MKKKIAHPFILLIWAFLSQPALVYPGNINLPYTEHFNYSVDTYIVGLTGSDWTRHSGTADDARTASTEGSLSYSGLPTSSGNRYVVMSSRGDDIGLNFASSISIGSIYASFIMKVTDNPDTGGKNFAHFMVSSSDTSIFPGRIYIRLDGSAINLGVARASSSSPTWASDALALNTVYFVVLKYTFGSTDTASLYINPSPVSSEPATPNAFANSGGSNAGVIERFALRQASGIGTIEIDELRIATTWADILPVTASEFIVE
ncbi:MAG: hypothetical protein NTY46_02310 [Candidatus Sumerlaeota bacterium]|nr:hypothetical protein [Candidatus Sumerlaeota bacterium]